MNVRKSFTKWWCGLVLPLLLINNVAFAQEPQGDNTTAIRADEGSNATAQIGDDDGSVAGAEQNEPVGGLPTEPAAIQEGQTIFSNNCSSCHAVHKKVVGPALANVYERQSIPWLINFIKYPQRIIESGDPYAVQLYQEYKQFMPNHDFLSDSEIKNILAYVQQETIAGPVGPERPCDPSDPDCNQTPPTESGINPIFLYIAIGALSLLLIATVLALFMLVQVLGKNISKQENLTAEDAEYVSQRFSLRQFVTNPTVLGIISFLFLAAVLKGTVDGLYSVGVQQGYAPEQPIPFSHKLHAGYYEIDCKYCHTGVEKSKSANIPSANICMNCHNQIRQESPNMQKIYAAIENDQPIEWVRVHNLPDLSYFNHSQHVGVAQLECENCHGDVKEMEVIQQHSLLTMGWCIACHRKTEVNGKDNAYYDRLMELHNSNSREPMVVEDIGGLECSKCHY